MKKSIVTCPKCKSEVEIRFYEETDKAFVYTFCLSCGYENDRADLTEAFRHGINIGKARKQHEIKQALGVK